MSDATPTYFIMVSSRKGEGMLLYSMPELPNEDTDSWLFGQLFSKEPATPIEVEICEGFEKHKTLPYFDNPPLVSQEFYQALLETGIDNIVAYDAVIRSEDDSVRHENYKAINIIGLVKAAGLKTVFTSSSTLVDASIDSLQIDNNAVKDLLIFRLAENISAIVVHEKVKQHLESKGFDYLEFRNPSDYFSL